MATFNKEVVDKLSNKYGVSDYFVRASIRGNRNSKTSETIRKEYNDLIRQIQKIINQQP